jgi:hypothetical protein
MPIFVRNISGTCLEGIRNMSGSWWIAHKKSEEEEEERQEVEH